MLRIDPASPIPLYAQIASRIRVAIATGELAPMARLPSVRTLASQLRLNPATVVRAYTELERDGLVVTRGTTGVFVCSVVQARRDGERRGAARRLIAEVLQAASSLGVTRDDLTWAWRVEMDPSVAERRTSRGD